MRPILIASVPLLVLAACSENATDAGNSAAAANVAVEGPGTGMMAAPDANNRADSYVANAAISDMYEIEASKLALEKSQSPEVKKFAQMMIADHTATTAKIKAIVAAEKLQLTPPTTLDARHRGMVDKLKTLSGKDFDREYLDQQTAAHKEAVNLHSMFSQDGDNEALKKSAGEIAPKVFTHYETVKQLDKTGADGTK